MHCVTNIQKDTYIKMLNFLAKNCDTFSLVEPNGDLPGIPYELPDIKKSLNEYLKEQKWVASWAGTKIKVRSESQKAIQHTYRCCDNSVAKLIRFHSFFEIEDQMDISFFQADRCVLFTTSHESVLMIDLDFWKDFFDNADCMLIKAKKFEMIL